MGTPAPAGGLRTQLPSRRLRRLIAVGGGRGGVGKSLLSVNLAVYLAQLGRHIVICDADSYCSGLHTTLGLEKPALALPEELAAGKATPVATTVPGLKLLPVSYDLWTAAPRRPSRMSHWMRPIDQLEVDYVVLNLGPSTTAATLDMFYEADVGICLAAPEPTAIEATYRFCRALFARRLRRSFLRERFKLRVVERALKALPPLPTPRAVINEIRRFDMAVANVAANVLYQLRPGLVIGKTRLKRDLDLGPAMSALSERYLGIAMEYMGHIEQDDAVWLTARRRRPLLIDAPTSKSARNIERVARRVLAALAQQDKAANAKRIEARELSAPQTLYDVLGVERTAGDDDIRRAFKLQREIFREGSLPLISLVDETAAQTERARIQEAYDTLLDAARKRAYDMSVFPDDERALVSTGKRRRSADEEEELTRLQAELAREIGAETQFTGSLLQRVREAQGIELSDIAQITKISLMHLRAIENEDYASLPALVYVRGFLQQIAKTLKLDPTQVTKTYLKQVRAHGGHE